MNYKFLWTGILFAALWASASPAAKIAVQYAQPLVIFQVRFLLAGLILLFIPYIIKKEKLPHKAEWKALAIFGFFNTTAYLSLFVLAIAEISAGLGSLSTSTNTLFISIISSFWLGEKIKSRQWIALFLGFLGVALACFPLFENNYASPKGLLLIFLSMLSYSIGTLYYSKQKWTLSRIAINGWQVLIGGIIMLPLTLILFKPDSNHFNYKVWLSILWLIVPVSIAAVQLWLSLLKTNTVKASFFLFLCPIFGFIYASLILNEPITYHTYLGTSLVLIALYIGQKKT